MEFKGTKGKWEMYKPDHIGCENVSIGELNGFGGYIELWHHHYNNPKEAKANALLISKAPEMLEMLIRMRDNNDWDITDLLDLKQLIKEATEL